MCIQQYPLTTETTDNGEQLTCGSKNSDGFIVKCADIDKPYCIQAKCWREKFGNTPVENANFSDIADECKPVSF